MKAGNRQDVAEAGGAHGLLGRRADAAAVAGDQRRRNLADIAVERGLDPDSYGLAQTRQRPDQANVERRITDCQNVRPAIGEAHRSKTGIVGPAVEIETAGQHRTAGRYQPGAHADRIADRKAVAAITYCDADRSGPGRLLQAVNVMNAHMEPHTDARRLLEPRHPAGDHDGHLATEPRRRDVVRADFGDRNTGHRKGDQDHDAQCGRSVAQHE